MKRRLFVLVATIAGLLAAFPSASAAGSSYISRTTGLAADAYWTQVDGTPTGSSPFGNVHVGWLYAYETAKGVGDAFVYISDFDCEPGQLPNGGHGEENGCTYLGDRFGEGFGLAFSVDKKLQSASLQGRLEMRQGGHGEPGGVVGNPSVDMTWTGGGNLVRSTSTYRYNDGTSSYTDRYRSSSRQASLGGILGPMSFDPDLSGGSISSFSAFSKGRTR